MAGRLGAGGEPGHGRAGGGFSGMTYILVYSFRLRPEGSSGGVFLRIITMNEHDAISLANAYYDTTVAIERFVRSEVVPVLTTYDRNNRFEEALAGLYYRMVLWCKSLSTLNDPAHFQVVRAGSRSVFEIYLDIHHLNNNEDIAEKMFAFTSVWKYHSASKIRDFLASHPELDRKQFRHQISLAENVSRKEEFDELIAKFWPNLGRRKAPDNWSGKNVHELAKEAGVEFELRYREEYGLSSLFVHSGLVAVDSMPRELFIVAYARGHRLFQESFLKATSIICERFHVFESKCDLRDRLQELSELPARILAQTLMDLDKQNLMSEGEDLA